jgi:ATP-dependent DNA helicase PIF1
MSTDSELIVEAQPELQMKTTGESQPEKMTLEQQNAFDWFANSNSSSVALLGAGGTGKSFVFQKLVSYCRSRGFDIAVTAMTGVAAHLIGGNTLHSTLGLGIAKDTDRAEDTVISFNARKTWRSIDVLFIDEISMCSGILFEKLDYFGRMFQDKELPFGGIRLVLSGDFLQLGPVSKTGVVYAFETDSWNRMFSRDDIFVFDKSIRQIDDQAWSNILLNIRLGIRDNKDMLLLSSRKSVKDFDENVVKIYCKNVDVDLINRNKLMAMIKAGAENREYQTSYNPPESKSYRGTIPDSVHLCVGARVMCVVNIKHQKIFNGSMGTVKRLDKDEVLVEFDSGITTSIEYFGHSKEIKMDSSSKHMSINHMPLRLCWASTVHKIQGATLDGGRVYLENAFAPGQVYVALSRFKKLNGISIEGFSPKAIRACTRSLEFYRNLKN